MALAISSVSFLASSPSSPFLSFSYKPSSPPSKLHLSFSIPSFSLRSPFSPLLPTKIVPPFHQLFFSAVQEIAIEESSTERAQKETPDADEKIRKLYVVNLPWDFSASNIDNLFSECGTVKDVEVIKQKNGKSRGFAFVTMNTWEEACAAIDKFNSFELQGRTIKVEFAKSMKKPPPPESATAEETRHKIYVSNLAWKVRSSNLRELFAATFNPMSARVIFDNQSGRSAGYGFVSFATEEEAEVAISAMNGKELMGRPIRLKMREREVDGSSSEQEDTSNSEG